jgi:uncharacterized protein YbaP (TraB family)
MRNLTLHILVLFIVAAGIAPAAVADDDGPEHFLWRVSTDDRTVHLLGSIHFMKKDSYPLDQVIEYAYARSELVVFETDLDDLNKAALQMLGAGTLDGDTMLADVVSEDTYLAVAQRFKDAGMDVGGFSKMKPWMVALSLTSFELMKAGYMSGEGIDAHFNNRAKEDGKGRKGLETVEFQVSLFADLTEEESEDFLRYTLEDLESVIPLIDEIVATWKAGDTEQIEELLAEGFSEHQHLFDRFVTDRNLTWLPEVEALLGGDSDAMVIVGSLHLVGEQGLIDLLRAKGYDVEQL